MAMVHAMATMTVNVENEGREVGDFKEIPK